MYIIFYIILWRDGIVRYNIIVLYTAYTLYIYILYR